MKGCLPGLLLGLAAFAGHAGVLRYCDASPDLDAAQRDTLLRVAAVVRQELQRSDTRVALVSRSGLDLSRLGVRYSHAGIGLAESPKVPWSVRQLYFDCDEGRARLFDQGLAGFVLGQHDARLGFVSLVLLPGRAAESLAQAALDERQALALLVESPAFRTAATGGFPCLCRQHSSRRPAGRDQGLHHRGQGLRAAARGGQPVLPSIAP